LASRKDATVVGRVTEARLKRATEELTLKEYGFPHGG
jgi:hypothetical protein